MKEMFMKFIEFSNNLFYGEYWFISWGVIALLVIGALAVEIPKLVKSFKEAKERGKK